MYAHIHIDFDAHIHNHFNGSLSRGQSCSWFLAGSSPADLWEDEPASQATGRRERGGGRGGLDVGSRRGRLGQGGDDIVALLRSEVPAERTAGLLLILSVAAGGCSSHGSGGGGGQLYQRRGGGGGTGALAPQR